MLSGSSPKGSSPPRERLIYALDYPSLSEAKASAAMLRGAVGVVKVGLELFVRHGPDAVSVGECFGCPIFLDLKLHDIPATIGRAVKSAADLGVRYLTVHALGGSAMLQAAIEHAGQGTHPPTIVAVTMLTSLDDGDAEALGFSRGTRDQTCRLAELAYAAGVRALVCSGAEAAMLRRLLGNDVTLITPGVRPSGAPFQTQHGKGDQKRVMTPQDAIAAGADMLVIGRPIRDASDPTAAAEAIVTEIAAALASPGA